MKEEREREKEIRQFFCCLGDVDVGILVPDKIDVGLWEVLADKLPAGAAGLVMPLEAAEPGIVDDGHAGLVAEPVRPDGTVRLCPAVRTCLGPVVELRRKLLLSILILS